mgnify:CR=1 FL=1
MLRHDPFLEDMLSIWLDERAFFILCTIQKKVDISGGVLL